MKLKLGFHYHVPAISSGGNIYLPGHLGRFIDSLAAQCQEVVCFLHSPRPAERPLMDYSIASPNVHLVDIGPHASVPRRTLASWRFIKSVRDRRKRLDAILVRGPSPLFPFVPAAAQGIPVILLLVSSYLDGMDSLPQPPWRKALIGLWAKWIHHYQDKMAKNCLTLVNSRRLYEQLRPIAPNLYETRTTTLTQADFFVREDTCCSPPHHLLYTGRITPEKGLFDMVEAVSLLMTSGDDVILDLVGWADEKHGTLAEIDKMVLERNLAHRVVYHGYKAVGPELFDYFKNADIFVIASQSSEGFPRTIWEAMAHSLPVVATSVGSIPDFLENNQSAILVPPKNYSELARAISLIIKDKSLRKKLIYNGIQLAKENTLENRSIELLSRITLYLYNNYNIG